MSLSDQPLPDTALINDPATKLAHKRLSVLDLAWKLGSVAEACGRSGMDRASFYKYKRRFQLQGLTHIKNLSPIVTSHPPTVPAEAVEQIAALALERAA